MGVPSETFGQYARRIRIQAGYGLRQAARAMGVSAAYLSRVETGEDLPSSNLAHKMARLYARPAEEVIAASGRSSLGAGVRGRAMQDSEELRALYRMGELLTPDELNQAIKYILRKKSPDITDEEIERRLSQLRAELPRFDKGRNDGLFAADIKPRFLSKQRIAEMAYGLLNSVGLNRASYVPPTPIERIVEAQDGISYQVVDLPPLFLGRSRWLGPSERQIAVSSSLADGSGVTNEHRFNFTLAHELFHALEHLLLTPNNQCAGLMRLESTVFFERSAPSPRRSAAQRAVDRWVGGEAQGQLRTNEDWREWQANTFASCLLMPEWCVSQKFRDRVALDFVSVTSDSNAKQGALEIAGELVFGETVYDVSLADLFNVSRQAMAIRLLQLGLVREVPG